MLLYTHQYSMSNKSKYPCVLTIGNFDGIHIGHQAVLKLVYEEAKKRKLIPSIMTFYPHPREYFANLKKRLDLIPAQISTTRDKLSAFIEYGINQIIIERFNEKLAKIPANVFIKELLVKKFKIQWILVGINFRFGYNRKGDIDLLRKAGLKYGFDVKILKNIVDQFGKPISSSDIRLALSSGNFFHAQNLLGRPFSLSGHVIHGKKLGRYLGFPTINLQVVKNFVIQKGVYIVRVYGLNANFLRGVANLGVRPTIENQNRTLLEINLLDIKNNINVYGKLIRVEFLHKLRDEKKFSNFSNLISAIRIDRQNAQSYFNLHEL